MLYLRRIAGDSMEPAFKHRQIVLAIKTRRPKIGQVIIIRHRGMEKIKRLARLSPMGMYVLGDNPSKSTDSRTVGWLPKDVLKARVVWPKR